MKSEEVKASDFRPPTSDLPISVSGQLPAAGIVLILPLKEYLVCMGYKSDRTAEDIKREITALVRELKDPRVSEAMLTVVRVEVAHDLSFAKVYISALGGISEAETACKALNGNAKGFIKKELGVRLTIRKTPDIRFIPDDSIEKSMELFKKLNSVKGKNEE